MRESRKLKSYILLNASSKVVTRYNFLWITEYKIVESKINYRLPSINCINN